ncbi:MAG: recombinase family protein [Candidatus Binataceae bacterium]|nr:recombinase family protein [Candidatus Binataceae bacterium]
MAAPAAARARGAPGSPRFVAYYRVSTDKQGASGLGLEAQRERVAAHIAAVGGKIITTYTEVESGKRNERPELAKALAECRLRRCVLIVAKLDRLARNARFLLALVEGLGDGGVVFCDLPDIPPGPIGKLIIGVLALIAEFEAGMTSQRTKAALAVVKAAIERDGAWVARRSGRAITRLGGVLNANRAGAYRARRAKSKIADERANDVRPYLDAALMAGCNSLRELARALNARGIPAPWGGEWTATQVSRAMARSAAGGCDR